MPHSRAYYWSLPFTRANLACGGLILIKDAMSQSGSPDSGTDLMHALKWYIGKNNLQIFVIARMLITELGCLHIDMLAAPLHTRYALW